MAGADRAALHGIGFQVTGGDAEVRGLEGRLRPVQTRPHMLDTPHHPTRVRTSGAAAGSARAKRPKPSDPPQTRDPVGSPPEQSQPQPQPQPQQPSQAAVPAGAAAAAQSQEATGVYMIGSLALHGMSISKKYQTVWQVTVHVGNPGLRHAEDWSLLPWTVPAERAASIKWNRPPERKRTSGGKMTVLWEHRLDWLPIL